MPMYDFRNGNGPFEVELTFDQYDIYKKVRAAYDQTGTLDLETLQSVIPQITGDDLGFLVDKNLIKENILLGRSYEPVNFAFNGDTDFYAAKEHSPSGRN